MGQRGPEPKTERNRIILERWLKGEMLESIGADYGVTRERIRQVIKQAQENPEDASIVDRTIARKTGSKVKFRFQVAKRVSARRELKELFKTRFDRDEIIRILEMGDDPDIQTLPDEALCALVYESFKVSRFFKYIRCPGCEAIKPTTEFAASVVAGRGSCYCRPCSTEHHRHHIIANPELTKRAYRVAKTKPNKSRIYQLRYHLRSQGREDEMPPLPPKGIPDSEVVTPPRKPYADNFKAWRESVGRTFNRDKAARKVKQIVKEDAASRHIEL